MFRSQDAAQREAERLAPHVDFDRVQGAFDNKRMVGTFLSFVTELAVPGRATVPADAISAVTVTSTHRRRGLLSTMMGNDLRGNAARLWRC